MKNIYDYISESIGDYVVKWISKNSESDTRTFNNDHIVKNIQQAYTLLKQQKVVIYYEITKGDNTSDISSLVEWAGTGGYWANMFSSDSVEAKRWHDKIAAKQKKLNF